MSAQRLVITCWWCSIPHTPTQPAFTAIRANRNLIRICMSDCITVPKNSKPLHFTNDEFYSYLTTVQIPWTNNINQSNDTKSASYQFSFYCYIVWGIFFNVNSHFFASKKYSQFSVQHQRRNLQDPYCFSTTFFLLEVPKHEFVSSSFLLFALNLVKVCFETPQAANTLSLNFFFGSVTNVATLPSSSMEFKMCVTTWRV